MQLTFLGKDKIHEMKHPQKHDVVSDPHAHYHEQTQHNVTKIIGAGYKKNDSYSSELRSQIKLNYLFYYLK